MAICTLSALSYVFIIISSTANDEIVEKRHTLPGNYTGLAGLIYPELIRYNYGFTIITTYEYMRSIEMVYILAICFSIFTYIWLYKFFIDCQNMIIAGAVVRWYFTR